MDKSSTFLAFDCGATSGRGILARLGGNRFQMEEVCRFPTVIRREGKRMFWDVEAIYGHFVQCLQDLGKQGVHLDSIGIDTWGVDFGCVGKQGQLLGLPAATGIRIPTASPSKFSGRFRGKNSMGAPASRS